MVRLLVRSFLVDFCALQRLANCDRNDSDLRSWNVDVVNVDARALATRAAGLCAHWGNASLARGATTAPLAQYVSVPLALSFIIRPTAAIPIAVISAYILIYRRGWFGRFVLWATIIAIPWITYNVFTWGGVLPPYYLNMAELVAGSTFQDALLGNLISPSRGIFVYSPVLVLAISGFALAIKIRGGERCTLLSG